MKPAMMVGGGGIGLIIIVVIALLTNNPKLLQQAVQQQPGGNAGAQTEGAPAADDETREFISVVLRDTEVVWTDIFRKENVGTAYREPELIMFSGQTASGCGMASAALGPFYCPADQKIYIDPSFFEDLERRHSAAGDFAQAYVIAHEVAHHVQKLIGFSDAVNEVRSRGNEVETNRASVRLELQADYLAGVWAHHAHKRFDILESGDIEEAIRAANQIGDDTLMREATGHVVPERYTHGTSEQRARWFKQGLTTGSWEGCKALFELDYSEL
jgi:predicted metalloprotease